MSKIADKYVNLISNNLTRFDGIYGIGKLVICWWQDKGDEIIVKIDSEHCPVKYYLDSCIEFKIVSFFKKLFYE